MSRRWRAQGLKSAVIPTMGALHAGHMALIHSALEHADRVVVTLFINPRQFGPTEDLTKYPRNEEADLSQLAAAGIHLVFAPPAQEMYPPDYATEISLAGPAAVGLEDKTRPHFFLGVATVVAKLFIAAETDLACFGEKDYQQLLVVRRLARDLGLPIEVLAVPTVREEDGLAMSSRNVYLSTKQRPLAALIYATLQETAHAIRDGKSLNAATSAARRKIARAGFKVDYVAARNADTLAVPKSTSEPVRLLAAARLGKVRLIDNISV